MENTNLNLDVFNPTKAELEMLVQPLKELVINGTDDKEGYNKVKEARIQLKNTRVIIQKKGKALREDAILFQKQVIEKEKELVAIIEPTEVRLQEEQDRIDLEKEKAKRVVLLPERKQKLSSLEIELNTNQLLEMDEAQFTAFYNQKNTEFLFAKEQKIQEEQRKIEVEKQKLLQIEIDKQKEEERKIQMELAIKEAEERAKKEVEEKIKRQEEERIRKEEEVKRKEQEEIKLKKIQQEKLESEKKYKDFLMKNGYTEETKNDFYISKTNTEYILYKKIDKLEM